MKAQLLDCYISNLFLHYSLATIAIALIVSVPVRLRLRRRFVGFRSLIILIIFVASVLVVSVLVASILIVLIVSGVFVFVCWSVVLCLSLVSRFLGFWLRNWSRFGSRSLFFFATC